MSHQKTCPYCVKEVEVNAIKCPYCREWLNKKEFTLRNPYVKSGLIIFLGLFFYLGLSLAVRWQVIGAFYKEPIVYNSSSKLEILNHRLVITKNRFSIIGEIENREDFEWNSVNIVAIFEDNKNVVSSIGTAYLSKVKANGRKAFEVSFGCSDVEYDPSFYSNYTIEIDDAQGPFMVR